MGSLASLLDRIYRIFKMFLLFFSFPEEREKDNPPIGGAVLPLTLFGFPCNGGRVVIHAPVKWSNELNWVNR